MSLAHPRQLAYCVLQLHSHVSPNEKFYFDVPTLRGIAPHPHRWGASWRVSFTRLLQISVETDAAASGVCPELSRAADQIVPLVVPKLLNPPRRAQIRSNLDPFTETRR